MNSRFWVFLFLVIASACSRKVTITDPYFIDKNKLVFAVPEFKYLNTRTRIQYKDADRNISTSASIRIRKDSIIWMSITPFLGIEVARAIINKDSMVFMNRLNREYLVYDFNSLSEQFQFEINYDLIQSLILGNMPLEYQEQNEIVSSKHHYIIRQDNESYSIKNYFSKEWMKLQKVEVSEKSNKNKMILEFDNYQRVEAISIPFLSLISLDYEQDNELKSTEIKIKHGNVALASTLRFPFEIPRRYVRK